MPDLWCSAKPYLNWGAMLVPPKAAENHPAAGDNVWYEVSRRTLDVIGSLLLLVFTLPLLLLVAFLIKVDLRGPVLYRQSRVGQHGRVFTMLKFRSMRADAEAAGPCWATNSDPRMTRIGAFIRATRLDEIPQLLNVLRGEMSLVGPRPERPHFVQQLAAIIPRYNERTHVLPGITGWAQINYPYGASVEDARAKLEFDLFYIDNRTLLLDLRILLGTIPVVLFRIRRALILSRSDRRVPSLWPTDRASPCRPSPRA